MKYNIYNDIGMLVTKLCYEEKCDKRFFSTFIEFIDEKGCYDYTILMAKIS